MKSTVIFEQGQHRWIVIGRDPEKSAHVIDTNEYVIVSKGQGMLLDPGGIEIFPRVLAELSKHVRLEDIRVLFASHQDPDIISSLALWLDLNPRATTYSSWLWTAFLAHFAARADLAITGIPDDGMTIKIGDSGASVEAVPAHYCHSSGNFSIFDPQARILFSGDIGGALLPSHESNLFVTNFEEHVQYMRGFHVRWMPSTSALRGWVQRVRALKPAMICPQHGAIFKGPDVDKLLNWLESLEVGQWGGKDKQQKGDNQAGKDAPVDESGHPDGALAEAA